MSVYSDVQTVLDNALYSDVLSYWMRKTGTDADEYVVYTIDSDEATNADDRPLIRNTNIAVRYYFKDSLIGTSAGRTKVQNRADAIVSALESNGYSVPYGPQNIGDIDDIGYGVLLIECYKGRVV
jgi:hypothetical protein